MGAAPLHLIRAEVRAERPYVVPTEADVPAKLDQNESPWDAPADVKQAAAAALVQSHWNRYPPDRPHRLRSALAARLDPTRWRVPSVMRLFGALGGLDDEELRATFNGGLGMVLVVPPAAVRDVIRVAGDRGIAASLVGEVVPVTTTGGARYVEGPLETLA